MEPSGLSASSELCLAYFGLTVIALTCLIACDSVFGWSPFTKKIFCGIGFSIIGIMIIKLLLFIILN